MPEKSRLQIKYACSPVSNSIHLVSSAPPGKGRQVSWLITGTEQVVGVYSGTPASLSEKENKCQGFAP